MKVVQLLGLQGPWLCKVCRDTDCLCRRSYGPFFDPLVAGDRSEGLFGQSFSVAPPIQTLRGLPCLRSFSDVPQVRHIEGPPLAGVLSVDWCIRHLKGQPGWGPTLQFSAGVWGEAMVVARDSAVSAGSRGCLAFLHRHFPPQSPPSHPLNLSLHSQQPPLPWDCSRIPKLQLPALHLPWDLYPCPGFVWLWQGLSHSYSISAVTDQLFDSQP